MKSSAWFEPTISPYQTFSANLYLFMKSLKFETWVLEFQKCCFYYFIETFKHCFGFLKQKHAIFMKKMIDIMINNGKKPTDELYLFIS